MLCAFVNTAQSLKSTTDWSVSQDGNPFKKTHHSLYHSLDRNHNFLHVKFEIGLCISFARKYMTKEKWHFSWRIVRPFFRKRCLKKVQVSFRSSIGGCCDIQ